MWIITTDGLFSINCPKEHQGEDRLVVRARRRDHLEAFCERAGQPKSLIAEKPKRDYLYRIEVSRHALNFYFSEYVRELGYDNVKGHIVPLRPELGELMHNCWYDGVCMQQTEHGSNLDGYLPNDDVTDQMIKDQNGH